MYRIESATAHANHTVTIRWRHGVESVVDFGPNIARGGVCAVLADPAFFVDELRVADDGYYLGWPGEIDFSADSLWHRTHPEDLARDFPDAAAE